MSEDSKIVDLWTINNKAVEHKWEQCDVCAAEEICLIPTDTNSAICKDCLKQLIDEWSIELYDLKSGQNWLLHGDEYEYVGVGNSINSFQSFIFKQGNNYKLFSKEEFYSNKLIKNLIK